MIASDQKPFCLKDFEPFLFTLHESGLQGVLIGGMAVAAWAGDYLRESDLPDFDLPLYSKDIDLRGLKSTMMFLAKDMQVAGAEITGYAAATRKAAPEMGQIHVAQVRWRGHRTSIEVLERLPGLDEGKAFPPAGHALVAANGLCLLDPCSLFICKLHAANTRPAEQVNNDINHLRILARLLPRFLAKIKAAALVDYDAREDAERLLRKIEACVRGDDGFQVPLAVAELEPLVQALREHLA